MYFYFNERSIHEQFRDAKSFMKALRPVNAMLKIIPKYSCKFHFSPKIKECRPMPDASLNEVRKRVTKDERDERMVLLQLFTNNPYQDKYQESQHGDGDRLECQDTQGNTHDVTNAENAGIGAATRRNLDTGLTGLISLTSPNWNDSRIRVTRKKEGRDDRCVDIENWLDATELECMLALRWPEKLVAQWTTWTELSNHLVNLYKYLEFSEDCFKPLIKRKSYSQVSAKRVCSLLGKLNFYKNSIDKTGSRTGKTLETYNLYFRGGSGATFFDSSDTDKRKFRNELTFRHPGGSGKLFCPWHGRENSEHLRVHFSWPIQAGKPVYVVYAGPKITTK